MSKSSKSVNAAATQNAANFDHSSEIRLPEGWENGKPAWEDEGLDIEALAKEYAEAPEAMKNFMDDMWDEEIRTAVHKNLRKSVSYKVVDSENNPLFAGRIFTLEKAQEALGCLIRLGCKKNTPYQIVEV